MREPALPEKPPTPKPPEVPRPLANLPLPAVPPPSPRQAQKPDIELAVKLWGAALPESSSPGATLRIVRPQPKTEFKTPSKLPDRLFSLNYQPKATQADYLVDQPLGEGGMGIVYSATQRCLNRPVAVKTIKPGAAAEESSKKQFLSEALITGKLDHPNVVPVHEMGANGEGLLFYSMKHVRGTSWGKAIRDKTLEDNLDILLRVSDAVAFAHAQGILHCDLKPDNIMLGDYGEVYVMDWGLALSVHELADDRDSGRQTILGGTPAYMPPEFAHNDTENTGPASDIYLLGAILYEILNGRPPHTGTTLSQVVTSASENTIPPIYSHAELAAIALRCMATAPGDRYPTVKEFQQDIRAFRTHLDSLTLADSARHGLEQAEQSGDYRDYSRALHGFEQALNLWQENTAARTGLAEARDRYARRALDRADLDLAESLLDRGNPGHQSLLRALDSQRRERDQRRHIMRRMKQGLITLAASIILILSIVQYWLRTQRNAAREEAFINGTRLAEQHLRAGDWKEVRSIRSTIPLDQAGWEWEWLEENSQLHLPPASREAEPALLARPSPDGNGMAVLHGRRKLQIQAGGALHTWNFPRDVLDLQWIRRDGREEILTWDGRVLARKEIPDGTAVLEIAPEGFAEIAAASGTDSIPGVLSPSGDRLLLLPPGHPALLFDAATGQAVLTLKEAGKGLQPIAGCVSPDGRRAALLLDPYRQVTLYDLQTGNVTALGPERHEAQKQPPDRLGYLPDNSALLVCGFGKGIGIHDPNNLTPKLVLPLPSFPSSFAASPDSRLVAGGGDQGDLVILDLVQGQPIWRLKMGTSALTTLLFDPDSQGIHVADASGSLFHLPLRKREPWQLIRRNQVPDLNLLVDEADRALFTGDQHGRLWRIPVPPEAGEPACLDYGVIPRGGLALTSEPAGRFVVFCKHTGLVAYDIGRQTIVAWGNSSSAAHVAASPDSRRLAVLTEDRRLEIYDTQTRKVLSSSDAGTVPANQLAWMADSRKLAVASVDGTLKVFDPEDPGQPSVFSHADPLVALASSPDGRDLATSTTGRVVTVWNLQTGKEAGRRSDFDDIVLDLAYTPDGRRLLCSSADSKVHVLDRRTLRSILSFQTHRGAVVQAKLSAQGSTLFTAGTDGELRLWPGTRTWEEWKP
jgi:serine/threonine protein kinase/WD40 repeat protein